MFKKITKIVATMLIVAFATATASPVTANAGSMLDYLKEHPEGFENTVDPEGAPVYGKISLSVRSYECLDFSTIDDLSIVVAPFSDDEYCLQHTDVKLYRNGKLVYKGNMYGDSDVSRETKLSKGATGIIDAHKHKGIKQGIYTIKYRYNHNGITTKWQKQVVPTGIWMGRYTMHNLENPTNLKWEKHPNAYKYDVYMVDLEAYKNGAKLVKVATTKKNKINLSKYGFVNGTPIAYVIDPVCKYKGKDLHVDLNHVHTW